jgi:phospholipid/cholesterol/gamma-HCH transport system substrate-binding protein
MESSAHATATGAFVLTLALLLGAAAYWLGGGTMRGVPYDLITGSSVAGLSTGAPVLLMGVNIGEVQRIGFDPANPHLVEIRALIKPEVHLFEGTRATLSYQGLSGTAYVELEFPEGATRPLRSSQAAPARISLRASGFAQLTDAAHGLIKALNATLGRVNAALTPQTLRNFSQLIRHLNEAAAGANVLMHDFQPAALDADGALKSVNRIMGPLGRTVTDADTLILRTDSPGGALDAIRSGASNTGQAAHVLESALVYQTLPQLDALARRLSRASDSLNQALQQFQSEPQSLIFGLPAPPPGPGEPGFARTVNR